MSKEYIEREATKTQIAMYFDTLIYEKPEGIETNLDNIKLALLNLMDYNTVAADVAPVVHGEWTLYPSDAYMKCSACEMEYLTSKMPQVVGYCPNCGAYMKEDTFAVKNYPRCHKCIHEIVCAKNADNEGKCQAYKRDPKDGGFSG